jgi:polyribonucleotide nucleotidyltransferase
VVIDIPNKDAIVAEAAPLLKEASFVKGKFERYAAIKVVHNNIKEKYAADFEDEQKEALSSLLHDMEKDILRESILADQLRTDGRGTEDIRQITCEINSLPLTHGSALFTRGEPRLWWSVLSVRYTMSKSKTTSMGTDDPTSCSTTISPFLGG